MLSGYSFKTSQYGFAIDNVARFELVLPNGTIANVTSEDEDLWFGLRVS
jgi:FAD/FMN-containing dehydrogenase